MTNYLKQPQSIEKQIAILKARGLVINDETEAKRYLANISYYRLSSYLIPFEKPVTNGKREHNFINGTDLNDIINLYHFDKQLRLHVLSAIEQIEIAIRAKWANEVANATKDSHAYTDSANFTCPWRHQKLLAKVTKDLSESKELFVIHYKEKYSNPFLPPIWAMTEVLSFTDLTLWFGNTKSDDIKISIARHFGFGSINILKGVLHGIGYIRNICAHHSRLWNRKMVKKLPRIKSLDEYLQKRPNNEVDNYIYNYLVVIAFMLKALNLNDEWQYNTMKLIDTLQEEHLAQMGFPKDHIFHKVN